MEKYAASFYETYYDTVISQLDRKNIVTDWRNKEEIMIVYFFKTPFIKVLGKVLNLNDSNPNEALFQAQVYLDPSVDTQVFPFYETFNDRLYTLLGQKNYDLLQGEFDVVVDKMYKVWDVDRDAPLDTKYVKSQTKKAVQYLTKEADRIAREFIKEGGFQTSTGGIIRSSDLYKALKGFSLKTKAKKPVTDHERKIFELFIQDGAYMTQAVQLAQTLGHEGIIISAIEHLGYSPSDISELFSMVK